MSNKRCNVCANPMEVWGYSRMDEHTIFKCLKCDNKEVVKNADMPLPKHKLSLFGRITASPEVLGKSSVYCLSSDLRRDDDGKVTVKRNWKSPFIDRCYGTEEEAIAATVAKLKELCDE